MEVEFGDKDCDRLETDPNFDAGQWQSLRLTERECRRFAPPLMSRPFTR
jgi:hypothetical protein